MVVDKVRGDKVKHLILATQNNSVIHFSLLSQPPSNGAMADQEAEIF